MTKHIHAKQERIVEAVRRGLEGDAAVEFIRQNGFAMTSAGIARNLKRMGGRGRIVQFIGEGKTNVEILELCLPEELLDDLHLAPPNQQDLFGEPVEHHILSLEDGESPLYDTCKLTVTVPADLYEALRLAARVEGRSQNQIIIEILTAALSRIPGDFPAQEAD